MAAMTVVFKRVRFVNQIFSKQRSYSSFIRLALSLSGRKECKRGRSKGIILCVWARLQHCWYSALAVPPTVAISFFGKSSSPSEPEPIVPSPPKISEEDQALEKADILFANDAIDELYSILIKYKDSTNAETLWRLARAARNKAERSRDTNEKKDYTYEALEYAKQAVELDNRNFACHKWYAITLSNVGDYEGTKAKIQNAHAIRDHFQKAIDINPTDPTSRHLLGLWCFTFADMPWYQHKIAAAIFSTPPSSSYEEALSHFEKAESLEADFFSKNHLMLGKTFFRLNKKEEAKRWLNRAANCTCKTVDDEQAKKEAQDLLKSLS